MNLKTAILAEHSRAQAEAIAKAVAGEPKLMADLWVLFRTGEPPIPQRASYAIRIIWDRTPALLTPYIPEIVRVFDACTHNAERRTLSFILSECELPEENLGTLVDACFGRLLDTSEAVAVQVYAMATLYRICEREPGLGNELAAVVESMMEHGSPAIQSRGKRVLAGLRRL